MDQRQHQLGHHGGLRDRGLERRQHVVDERAEVAARVGAADQAGHVAELVDDRGDVGVLLVQILRHVQRHVEQGDGLAPAGQRELLGEQRRIGRAEHAGERGEDRGAVEADVVARDVAGEQDLDVVVELVEDPGAVDARDLRDERVDQAVVVDQRDQQVDELEQRRAALHGGVDQRLAHVDEHVALVGVVGRLHREDQAGEAVEHAGVGVGGRVGREVLESTQHPAGAVQRVGVEQGADEPRRAARGGVGVELTPVDLRRRDQGEREHRRQQAVVVGLVVDREHAVDRALGRDEQRPHGLDRAGHVERGEALAEHGDEGVDAVAREHVVDERRQLVERSVLVEAVEELADLRGAVDAVADVDLVAEPRVAADRIVVGAVEAGPAATSAAERDCAKYRKWKNSHDWPCFHGWVSSMTVRHKKLPS